MTDTKRGSPQKRTFTVKASVITPSVPNFIRCADGQTLPLSAFEDDGLRQIAAAWTEELIANAVKQRAERAK